MSRHRTRIVCFRRTTVLYRQRATRLNHAAQSPPCQHGGANRHPRAFERSSLQRCGLVFTILANQHAHCLEC